MSELKIPAGSVPFGRRVAVAVLKGLPPSMGDFGFRVMDKLARTVGPYERVATTYFGARMQVRLDDTVGRCIYHFGVWEPHISAFVQQRLRPGDVFCDIGANFGYYTLLASHAVGCLGQVVAIEPSPSCLAALRANTAFNYKGANIRIIEAAVSDRSGTATLYRGPPGNTLGQSTLVPERGHGTWGTVPIRPLEEILGLDELRAVKLIKIDVEGAEAPILMRLAETIERYSPDLEIIVEMSNSTLLPNTPSPEAIRQRFAALGFCCRIIPNVYTMRFYLDFRGAIPPVPAEAALDSSLDWHGEQDFLFTRRPDAD